MVRRLFTALSIFAAIACLRMPAAYAAPPVVVNPDVTTVDRFPSDPEGAIRAARELIAAGKMDSAIKALQAYVNAHPYDFGPRRFLGDLYFRAGQIDRAKFVYEDILRLDPADKETHNRLGTVYAVQNRIDDAIAQFNAALPGTDSVDDLVALHQRKGDFAAYRTEMEHLALQNPTDAAIQAELGQVYDAIHQPYSASVYFRRALDSDPTSLTALNGLGLALLNMHDYTDAIAQFQTCLRLDSTVYQCEDDLGAAQLEAKEFDQAKTTLDIAHKLAPERAETFVNYGFLSDARGDWQRAVAYYAQAIAMWPYLRESYIDLALTYEDHRMYPLAQAALLKGIAAVPDDGRMHFLLGRAYEAQGDKASAMAQYKLAESGTDPDAVRIAHAQFQELGSGGP